MASQHDMDTGRVAPANFQTVHRVKGNVDCIGGAQRRCRTLCADQVGNRVSRGDSVADDRPLSVLHRDESSVDRFELGGGGASPIESGFDFGYVIGDSSTGRSQFLCSSWRIEHRLDAGHSAKGRVHRGELISNR